MRILSLKIQSFTGFLHRCLLLLLNFTIVFLISFPAISASTCSKIKVEVNISIVDLEKFVNFLNKKYSTQNQENLWLSEIEEKLLAELKKNSPDIEFTSGGKNIDYVFDFDLALTAAGEQTDVGGIVSSEFTGFMISSKLKQNNACGFAGRIVEGKFTGAHAPKEVIKDLYRTIEYHIYSYGSISGKIKEFEKQHLVPPRGPSIVYTLSRKFVSPIKDEREMEIRFKVKNCRGEDVFDKYRGQIVLLPVKLERGELKPTKGFDQGIKVMQNTLMLFITGPQGASATYTLSKGTELYIEPFKIITCGIDKKDIKDVFIPVAGIELEALAKDAYVFPGDKTIVKLKLNKVLPSGTKAPIPGRKITISSRGVKDGKLTPSRRAITKKDGRAVLNYTAGMKDMEIDIKATFRPENYPEYIEDTTGFAVVDKHYDWLGTVNINYVLAGKSSNKEESTMTEVEANIRVNFLFKAGEEPVILGKGIKGSGKYLLYTFSRSKEAACTPPGGSGVIYIRPGGWKKTEIKGDYQVFEKNFKIYPEISIYRDEDKYSFRFGVAGVYLKGTLTREETHHSACTGKTEVRRIGPNQLKHKPIHIESVAYEGKTPNFDFITGRKVIKTIMTKNFKIITRYNWQLRRINKRNRLQ